MKGFIATVLVMGLLLFGCTGNQGASAPSGVPAAGGGGQSLVGTKFSDWRYYSMAIPIAPGQINASTQAALNVFTVDQAQQPDGSLLVTVLDSQDSVSMNFTVLSGQTLFFSDGNPSDDLGNTSDGALLDDHFVVVDGSGSIVQAVTAQ